MLRITLMNQTQPPTLKLEGSLLEPWLDEVNRACAAKAQADQPRLDLAELRFADAAGIALLRTLLRERGYQLIACSRFVSELLEERTR